MKLDRLLSILIQLLNHDRLSARELAEQYQVSVRTIQRDMDALTFAGIPIVTSQGAYGGYGIMKNFTLDRQLINTDDLFFILTALESITTTFKNDQITSTLDKMKTLAHDYQSREIQRRREEFFIDFSAFGLYGKQLGVYKKLEEAISEHQLVEFTYHSNKLEQTARCVEPMTLIFYWYSWYLFGYCRLRNDYRLFRISRMRDIEVKATRFIRKEQTFHDSLEKLMKGENQANLDVKLRFDPSVRFMIEDYFTHGKIQTNTDGSLLISIRMPESDWLVGMILGYGETVEVLEPESLRQTVLETSLGISKKYQQNS